MYYDINPDKSQCEFGIMIGDREYWGRGYGTDVVKSALKHIFTSTRIKRVYLHTLIDNFRAQKSFARAGFNKVREVKRDGYEFVLMEVHQKDWTAAHPEEHPTTADEVLESATSTAPTSQVASEVGSNLRQHQTDADPLPGS